MKKFLAFVLVFAGLHVFAQNESVINDPNAQKRTLDQSFSAIAVSDGIELYLSQGNEESIAVSASDPKYMERYKTEVVGNTLKLYYDNKGMGWSGNDRRKLKAYVSFKTLEKLTGSSGANVMMKGTLNADKMEYTFTSGSRFSGDVSSSQAEVTQSSGAMVEMNGKTGRLKIDVSSGAIFKGYDLSTDFCDASASSGGGVRISVSKELSVKASSGGGIHYKGDGVVKDMNVSSGGIVKKG